MTIASASIDVDCTFTPSGGTATTLKTKESEGTGHIVFLDDGSDLISQKIVEFSYKKPKVQASAPNGYTQGRNSVVIKSPLGLDNDERTVNTVRIEVACDYETTAAEKLTLRNLAIHSLLDSEFLEFWDDQSAA
jgi:hypothetical protein